jgi:RNA polymerase primary sigma factor
MGDARRRATPRHGPLLGSDEALGVCDDPPGDSVEVPGLDQSGLDAAGLGDVAGPADVDMAGPGEADLAAEAAVEGVVLDDLGDLAGVDGVQVDADLQAEDKDGTHAVAGDLGDALTAGPLAAAGAPGVSAPGEEPAPAAGGGAAAAGQAGVTRPGGAEGEDEAFVYGGGDDDLPAAQVASAGATADPVKDYLKQIGKVPLLNAEQEVELAKRIEAGLFAEEKLADACGCRKPVPPGQML